MNHTVDNIPPDESMMGYVNTRVQNQKVYSNRQSVMESDEPTRPLMPENDVYGQQPQYVVSPQISGQTRARAEHMSKTDPKAFSYPGQPTDSLTDPRRLPQEEEYYDEEEEAELNA